MVQDIQKSVLRFYSDFIWPFCYIAERASLVRLEKDFFIEVDWHGFELHPETPQGGIELARLHLDHGQNDLGNYILRFAAQFGIHDIVPSKRLPNTRRALAVAEFSRERGKLKDFRSLTMDAHWKEGRNIEDNAVLRALASASGLDPEKALLAADDPLFLDRVDQTRTEYKKLRTGGIPTFVFGSEIIEGCRPYEVLVSAANRAGFRPI